MRFYIPTCVQPSLPTSALQKQPAEDLHAGFGSKQISAEILFTADG